MINDWDAKRLIRRRDLPDSITTRVGCMWVALNNRACGKHHRGDPIERKLSTPSGFKRWLFRAGIPDDARARMLSLPGYRRNVP